jgi:hypothetical protein
VIARCIAGSLLVMLAAACTGIRTHRVVTGVPGPPFSGAVAIHMDGSPLPQHYQEVALVQAEGGGANLATLLPALREQAAAVGCDAVILVKVDQGASHASATGVAVRLQR